MKEITEDYVSLETAKLLKEKGFDEDINLWYDETGEMFFELKYNIGHNWRVRNNQKVYECPTLQMAMKWLRSNKFEVIVQSETDYDEDERGTKYYHTPIWYFTVYRIYDSSQMSDDARYFSTFEEACEAGIKYCLENLI